MVAGLVLTYVSAAVPWVFVAFYQVMSRGAWRHDPMGWHIMALTAVDAAIFTQLIATTWWPQLALDMWWRWTQLLVVAGIPLVTVWRGLFLWRAYHPRSSERSDDG